MDLIYFRSELLWAASAGTDEFDESYDWETARQRVEASLARHGESIPTAQEVTEYELRMVSPKRFEFIVSRVLREGDHALVDGRVGDGNAPIRVGDSFAAIRGYSLRRNGDEIQIDYGPHRPVRLVVDSIEAYRRSLGFIDSGMTARLTLRGDGLDTLADDTILSS